MALGNEKLPSTGASTNSNTNHNRIGHPENKLSYGAGGDDDDYQMFHISPRFFLKRDMTMSYMRVEDDSGGGHVDIGGGGGKRSCNFPPRLGMSNLMASMILSRRDLSKWNKSQNNNSSCCSDDEIVTNMKDGNSDVIGIGTGERMDDRGGVESRTNNSTSNRNPINFDEQGIRTQEKPTGSETVSTTTTWMGHKNEGIGTTTTSFIVPETLKVDKCRDAVRHSRSWCRSTPSNPIEIADRTNSATTKDESLLCAQIVFEKVKYDKTKRYLRHTPSESSTASSPRSVRSNGRLLSLDRSQSSSFSLDDNSFSDNNLYSSSSPSHSFCSNGDDCHIENECSCDPNGNCCHPSMHDGDSTTNPSEKAINRINSLRCRKYSETWDSNGNSADSRRILCEEAWNVFENKINTARDKKMMILYTEDAEDFIRSASPRSSSTTLETWIDDEIFDNSFNEELERHHRHCASSFER